MTNNRFLAALRLLLGKNVSRITLPPGTLATPGPIVIEGIGHELRGWHPHQSFTVPRFKVEDEAPFSDISLGEDDD